MSGLTPSRFSGRPSAKNSVSNEFFGINLKAAAKFSVIALGDENKYKNQIKAATKELSVRWLMNLVEPYRDKLSDEENENIDKLVDYIKSYFS